MGKTGIHRWRMINTGWKEAKKVLKEAGEKREIKYVKNVQRRGINSGTVEICTNTGFGHKIKLNLWKDTRSKAIVIIWNIIVNAQTQGLTFRAYWALN